MENQGIKKRKRMHIWSSFFSDDLSYDIFYFLPWQINNTLIIFLYLHLSLVFLLKCLIFQGFPTFEFSFLFKVSSQIFSYFLIFFPAILVNPLVKQASLPTGFFNYSLSDILLPLHHQNSHGCKCSRLHWCLRDPWYTARFSDSSRILPY